MVCGPDKSAGYIPPHASGKWEDCVHSYIAIPTKTQKTPMPSSSGVNMDPGPLRRGADAGAPDTMHPAQIDIEAYSIDRERKLVCYAVPEGFRT